MNNIHKRRLTYITIFLAALFLAIALILYALKQNINVFLTPAQIAQTKLPTDYRFRLGGMVKPASVKHDVSGLGVTFVVTDFKKDLRVRYHGILPDLFREGKGVIATGTINSQGIFIASEVLAKHDENYMPKSVYREMNNKLKETS